MDELRKEIEEYTGFMRQALQLVALTPRGRRARLGRWFRTAHAFALRAARVLERHREYLDDLEYTEADILAQDQRVRLLEDVQAQLLILTKETADTLLKERTELYNMSTAVMKGLARRLKSRSLPTREQGQITRALLPLRRVYDLGRGTVVEIAPSKAKGQGAAKSKGGDRAKAAETARKLLKRAQALPPGARENESRRLGE